MSRIIKIAKRNWLAGMTWSSFEDTPSKDDLKKDAQRFGATWTCVRVNESVIQAGFSAPVGDDKQPTKLYSLAAMLADSREQPWLGIFRLEEGLWWYIAVRDGHAILPDGDVVGGEDEIHAARDRHAGYTDWKYIEGDISLLDEFIQSIEGKPTPVRSLVRKKFPVVLFVLAVIVLFVIGSGGYIWWNQKQQGVEKERIAAMAKVREQMLAGQTAVSTNSPLLSTPQPNDWLAACGSVISEIPLSKNGWQIDAVMCDAQLATIHWIRKEGATVAIKPDGNLSAEGDEVQQNIPLEGLNQKGTNNAIDLPTEKVILRAWAQAAKFTLAMNDVVDAPPLPGATVVAAPVQTAQANFKLNIPVSPFELDMSVIPGLRLTGLISTDKGWIVEGILYAR